MRILAPSWLSGLGVLAGCVHGAVPSASVWRDHVAPANGVAFRAPSAYKSRNAFGCLTRDIDHWLEAGWRDFCVDTLDAGASYSFTNAYTQKCSADCVTFEDLSVDTTLVEGHRAVVERARATGGINGMNRERQILVRIEMSDGTIVVLHGSTGDDVGYTELLAIAVTMRPLRDPQAHITSPPT